jgi:hypothetical protein
MPEQQQGGPIGPVEVVEDQDERPLPGDAAERRDHRLEEPVALGLRQPAGGLAARRHVTAQLRHEPAQLLELEAEAGAEVVDLTAQDEVRDHVDEGW